MSGRSEQVRYVVLRHEGIPEPHFDFMIEAREGGELPTWRATNWPPSSGDRFARAPDHRRVYLDYEGALSGDRGHVRRVVGGLCQARLTEELLQVTFPTGFGLTLVKDSSGQWLCTL